jgi:hypothetical protein
MSKLKELKKRNEKPKPKIKLIALAAVIFLIAVTSFFVLTSETLLEVSPAGFNFGELTQAGGKASTVFTLSNKGSSDLIINKIITSCGCTSAQLEVNGEQSPVFGMHSRNPSWSQTIKPGESAKLIVYYDPRVHSSMRGTVTRTVEIYSNDPIGKKEIKITATQV